MTADELVEWMPASAPTIEGLWTSPDRRFLVTDDDRLALAEWDDTGWQDQASASDGPDGAGRPLGTLRVTLDRDALDGAGGPIPLVVARAAGLRPGARRTFPTRYGPVALSFEGNEPSRGSLRPIALAAGASAGDALVITLYPGARAATVSVVPGDPSAAAPAPAPEEKNR